jgi:hypothetical protein
MFGNVILLYVIFMDSVVKLYSLLNCECYSSSHKYKYFHDGDVSRYVASLGL